MVGLKVSILGQNRLLGPKIAQNGVFAPQICYRARMNTLIGDKLFQDIPRRLAKFRENRPRDVEKSVDGKK